MADFRKPRFDRPSFGQKSFGNRGGFDHGPKKMFKAECAKCGNVCEVPFRPTGERPVYCNNCFVKDDASRGPRREFSPRPSFKNDFKSEPPAPRPDQAFNDLKAELRGVNEKLERLITLMTPAPTTAKVSKKKKGE